MLVFSNWSLQVSFNSFSLAILTNPPLARSQLQLLTPIHYVYTGAHTDFNKIYGWQCIYAPNYKSISLIQIYLCNGINIMIVATVGKFQMIGMIICANRQLINYLGDTCTERDLSSRIQEYLTCLIAGKPFPVRNCTLTNLTSNSAEVSCLAGFDGGLPQHFFLELYTENGAVPRYNITASDAYFFLDNLEPDVTFRMVVYAVNAKGRSQGVVLEEVTFRDAEKRTGKF